MRRIWYGLGILVLGAGIILLGYYLRPKNKAAQTYLDNTPSLPEAGGAPNAPSGELTGLKPIFVEQLLAYSAFAGKVWGVDTAGKIWNTDGKTEASLSSTTVPGAFMASFSYDQAYVLVGAGETLNPQFRIWNFQKNTWRFLPSGVFSPTFSPDSHNLAYLENTPAGTRLSILNLDSTLSRGTATLTLPLTDIVANWISSDKIEFRGKSALLSLSSDFIYSRKQKNVTPVVIDKNGLDLLWSPTAKTALALLGQARGGSMFLIDGGGGVLQTLSILTLPEKCAWRGETKLFCALPQDANALKIPLPDEFYKGGFFTDDNFYEIAAGSGEVTSVLENKNGLDAVSLNIYGNSLYFLNRLDQKLYSLPLTK